MILVVVLVGLAIVVILNWCEYWERRSCAAASISNPQPQWWRDAVVMAKARKEIREGERDATS